MTARAEWLQRRRRGVGASDVASILGLSPYGSPYSAWLSKVADIPDDEGADDDREFGRRCEGMILDWFQDKTGLFALDRGLEVAHRDHPEFMATLDGRAYESAAGTVPIAVVEAKSTRDVIADWEREIPIGYRCQVIWQMFVTGLDHAFVPTLHRYSGQFRLYEVSRDKADEDFVVERCTAFWHDYVLAGIAPPVDDHDATTRALKQQWPTADGTVDADPAARDLVDIINELKDDVRLSERELVRHENELRALLGEREALVDGVTDRGKPNVLASWKTQTATRLDTDSLRKAWPDLAREFEKTTTMRVLRVAKPKGE